MARETVGGAIIYYVNGEKEELFFYLDGSTPDDQQDVFERMQKSLQSNLLVLKTTANLLVVIPTHSILKIEIKPAPSKVPENVIKNVRIVTST